MIKMHAETCACEGVGKLCMSAFYDRSSKVLMLLLGQHSRSDDKSDIRRDGHT